MVNQDIHDALLSKYQDHYDRTPTVVAYAPGRVEVLGNHTDYNEGFVQSAAINFGTFFAAAPRADRLCRLTAGDLMQEVTFEADSPERSDTVMWSNYVRGVVAGLGELAPIPNGFDGMFFGNIPLGSGLSSSAALEMAAGLCLARLFDIEVDRIALARIGQAAEHTYAGVKCGLLDQISSLYGRCDQLVMSDFRSLEIHTVALGEDACFLMCNTHAKHALVDGEYNLRREQCEEAAAYFATVLEHPVTALRDVSWAEWEAHKAGLPELTARRAAHPIGENERVLAGARLLAQGDLAAYGKLMFDSHESSRHYFENSCPELDLLVDAARGIPGVLGARLSGGGFGGSVVVLVHPRDVQTAAAALARVYARTYGAPCDTCVMTSSDGAHLVTAA